MSSYLSQLTWSMSGLILTHWVPAVETKQPEMEYIASVSAVLKGLTQNLTALRLNLGSEIKIFCQVWSGAAASSQNFQTYRKYLKLWKIHQLMLTRRNLNILLEFCINKFDSSRINICQHLIKVLQFCFSSSHIDMIHSHHIHCDSSTVQQVKISCYSRDIIFTEIFLQLSWHKRLAKYKPFPIQQIVWLKYVNSSTLINV